MTSAPRLKASDSLRIRFDLVDVDILKPHEGVTAEQVERTVQEIRSEGFVRKPVLVEDEHLVILDGHHRVEALKEIGCRRVPCYLVDYRSEDLTVTTWPGAVVDSVTKGEVIRRALAGNLLPPKTTRHILTVSLQDVTVDLEDLM